MAGAFKAVTPLCVSVCVCALWFLDQQIQSRLKKGSYMYSSFTSSWLKGSLVGCTVQKPCLWSGGYALWNSLFL